MKCITIVGARPQFIKAAVVSRALRERAGNREILVHTGQHYDREMSDIFFDELDIPRPDYNLGIGSGNHGQQTARMLEAIEKVLLDEKPDRVLVYGDTNSTLAGALAAVKLQIPIAHVEAGLRSFNRCMPEEINRVLTDHASEILFAPTETAMMNLLAEGIDRQKCHLVGDVMYDGALYYGQKAAKCSQILTRLNLNYKNYILATIHRAENTDAPDRLLAIFEALSIVSRQLPVVVPLHPRTRRYLQNLEGAEKLLDNILGIEPVGYLDMIELEKNARLIATDSGGIQKEAFFYRVPCITLRDETEWIELVTLGWNRVISPKNSQVIVRSIEAVLNSTVPIDTGSSPYGEGRASEKIVEILER